MPENNIDVLFEFKAGERITLAPGEGEKSLIINAQSQVVNSLELTSETLAPSISAVKNALGSISIGGGGGGGLGRRQMDLFLPGRFAAGLTNTALELAGDMAYWLMDDAEIQRISAICAVADSGGTPAQVRLYVDGQPVGESIAVYASLLSTQRPENFVISKGAKIEIAVTGQGANGDSENLRVFIAAGPPSAASSGRLRQLDLHIPGAFAETTTEHALADAGDAAYWMLESARLKRVCAQSVAADSGQAPARVRVVVNGEPVGEEVQVVASGLTIIEIEDEVIIHHGARIEAAVTYPGTNHDSRTLRLFIVAEV
jgi:hypothetical protein